MLYILLTTIILLPVLSGIGSLAEFFTGNIWKGISGKIVSGIIISTLTFVIIAFFYPLNIYIEVAFLSTGIISFLYFKIYRDFYLFLKANYKIFIPGMVIISVFGSFFPFILDHFGYYVPSIKWLTEVGLIKGISNLDLLLGQMSFWHIFQAGFSHIADPFLRINAVLMLVYLIYTIEKKSWLHFIFFPILLLFTQSPSPDLPVIILSLIVLNEILNKNTKANLLFAISVFIFAIKPTMIWVPIFCLIYAIFILKSNLKFIFLGSIIGALFIFKNLYTFGYPVFPVSVLDLNLAWKPNRALLNISSDVAIQKTFDMQYNTAEINQFSTWDYIRNWLFLDGLKSVIHTAFIVLLIIFSIFTLTMKNKVFYLLWIAILIKSTVVLLFSAQYRFFIDVFFVIIFIFLYELLSKKLIINLSLGLTLITFTLLSFPKILQELIPSFKLGNYMSGISKDQFLKPSTYASNKYTTYKVGNLEFNVVKNYPFNYDTPLPAISPEFLKEDYEAGIFPQKISEDLKDGFVWKKLNDPQKIELKKILLDLGY